MGQVPSPVRFRPVVPGKQLSISLGLFQAGDVLAGTPRSAGAVSAHGQLALRDEGLDDAKVEASGVPFWEEQARPRGPGLCGLHGCRQQAQEGGDSGGAVRLQPWFPGEHRVDEAGRDPAACCFQGGLECVQRSWAVASLGGGVGASQA